ncbi:hypothetical protein HER10_EVM0004490 [Colletotrichum scovillei]|uniref:Uncharacterized protein n=1 Tax=Colletotrichum scovillei TaxID=1209932 RepID=A0A9P7R1C2_9PEZI|nr:uncharacterized protein HER10_EVM0004490 [Colletotrichum scovillei]KAF4779503.1 hypothetical protein HER10_EVM0004490 [Colletotrichum scovillei]KAG7047007.1 hypothetical protein JMJ77_0015224 [Colletotrichum scovillei]KAG7056846.1 hypothetical protein JMJ78_0000636 [Colletotrichum scovillei]KAG7066777.1 hypothetical protein JMJ76_0000629 [Colletotrichum scovillei]
MVDVEQTEGQVETRQEGKEQGAKRRLACKSILLPLVPSSLFLSFPSSFFLVQPRRVLLLERFCRIRDTPGIGLEERGCAGFEIWVDHSDRYRTVAGSRPTVRCELQGQGACLK